MIEEKDQQFFDQIGSALKEYEADYNANDWLDIEAKLDAAKPAGGFSSKKAGLLSTVAGGLLLVGALTYFNQPEQDQPQQNINSQVASLQASNDTKSDDVAKPNHEDITIHTVGENKNILEDGNKETSDEGAIAIENQSHENTVEVNSPDNPNYNKEFQATTESNSNEFNSKVYPTPVAEFSAETEVCVGETVPFAPDQTIEGLNYSWNLSNGLTVSEAYTEHSWEKPGVYTISLTATNQEGQTSTKDHKIKVHALPEANFKVIGSDHDSYISFEANSPDATSWEWDYGDRHQQTDGQRSRHLYRYKGAYTVTLTTVNAAGCTNNHSEIVDVRTSYNLKAPTGFTPNGDGRNDFWLPYDLEHGDYEFSLQIINRNTGNIVFTSSDKSQKWDGGNAKEGEVYVWLARVKEDDSTTREYSGNITILK